MKLKRDTTDGRPLGLRTLSFASRLVTGCCVLSLSVHLLAS